MQASTPHSPISLDGNAELAGFPNKTGGLGTSWADAIIIENLEIDAAGSGSCIAIQNTNAFLVIRNCTVSNSGGDPDGGIKLSNCTNVNITGCNAFNNWVGFNLEHVNNASILGNNVSANLNGGIALSYSGDNVVSGNNASNNAASAGIYLYESIRNTIQNNTCDHNAVGIDFLGGQNNTVSNNSVSSSSAYGISLWVVIGNHIQNNSISSAGSVASIRIRDSSRVTIRDNNCSESVGYGTLGVWILGSTFCHLENNLLNNCGVDMVDSNANTHFIDISNKINGKAIYYFANESALTSANVTTPGQVILANCSNSSFSGLSILNSPRGVNLLLCKNISFTGCAFTSCLDGISMVGSSECQVNATSIQLTERYSINIDSSDNNTFDGNQFGNTGYFSYSDRNNITGNSFTPGLLEFRYSHENYVFNNSFQSVDVSIMIYRSENNTVLKNNITSSGGSPAVAVWFSYHGNTIERNNITSTNGQAGILVSSSNETSILGNNITNNQDGIWLLHSNDTTVRANNISNSFIGIHIQEDSRNNLVYLNSFTNSTYVHAWSSVLPASSNAWDNGTDGNYWDNYRATYPSATNSGTHWNTPYEIHGDIYPYNGGGLDNHPLTGDLLPIAHFSADASYVVVGKTQVHFNFTGDGGNMPPSFLWDFGDGLTSALENPTMTFNTPGIYNVSLTVTDVDGDSDFEIDIDRIMVVANLLPVSTFTASATTITAGGTVQFTFTGSPGNEFPEDEATYLWYFGDGTNSGQTNASHTYATAGTYSVFLWVTDADGDEVMSAQLTITVNAPQTETPGVPGYGLEWILLSAALSLVVIVYKKQLTRTR
jgi:parallel beta-helix repeat protein